MGNAKHGESVNKTHLYRAWRQMKCRCKYKKYHGYHNYGGRGITVCKEWENDYVNFRDWAIRNGYKEGLKVAIIL